MLMTTQNIQEKVKHNYIYLKKKTLQHDFKNLIRMDQEIENYKSTPESCNCSGNKPMSSILGIDIPCIHRLFLGKSFPECPNVKLRMNEQWNELIDEYIVEKDDESENKYDIDKLEKKLYH